MKKLVGILLTLSIVLPLYAQNRFSRDSVLVKIYNHQYEREADSLISYFNSKVAAHRYEACISFASIQDSSYVENLLKQLNIESIDSLKAALIFSIGQTNCSRSFYGLKDYFKENQNDYLENHALEAIGKLAIENLNDFYLTSFKSRVSKTEPFIVSWLSGVYYASRRKQVDIYGSEEFRNTIDSINELHFPQYPEVNALLVGILNEPRVASPETIKKVAKGSHEIDSVLKTAGNEYRQLVLLKEYELKAPECLTLVRSRYHPIIRHYALDYYLKRHSWHNKVNQAFYEEIFKVGDVSLVSRLCEFIIEQKKGNKPVEATAPQLRAVQGTLELPRDFEAWNDLEKAACSLENRPYTYRSMFQMGYKNLLDWDYILKIDEVLKVQITTNKAVFLLQCKVNEAPGSVANFLKLVDAGYYNGKYFHRVVPNFVIQAGCPRGDGWGSLDWNQRSEFSNNLRYKTGSVGLASLGKDSEGVQFFITHTSTPNLNGRYTIFAETIKGYHLIGNIEVGDKIVSITRIK